MGFRVLVACGTVLCEIGPGAALSRAKVKGVTMEDEMSSAPVKAKSKLSREEAERLAEEIMAGERFARSGSLLKLSGI